MQRPIFLIVMSFAFVLCASAAWSATFTVFAAASMKNALDEVVRTHEIRTKDKVVVSYAASSALARQIEQGAPADVFVSADLEWMDYLEKRKLIQPASRFNVVRNRLALIAPADSRSTLRINPGFPLAASLVNERLSMANPDSVPAGRYGKAALESLGVWKDVQSRVASANDVRGALLLVARGETPFGIVYSTDAAVEPKVRVVDTFPENTHPPIVYPAALTAESRNGAAKAFLSALREAPARAVFDKYGFK
ncbi:MAG TPA: molybdate ABC transporter substrate-binding protein [Burkholderiales bacterium]|nr:molybdate ABC transporter substrate-binding protein [Burkholderiales bacterium]